MGLTWKLLAEDQLSQYQRYCVSCQGRKALKSYTVVNLWPAWQDSSRSTIVALILRVPQLSNWTYNPLSRREFKPSQIRMALEAVSPRGKSTIDTFIYQCNLQLHSKYLSLYPQTKCGSQLSPKKIHFVANQEYYRDPQLITRCPMPAARHICSTTPALQVQETLGMRGQKRHAL